MGVKGKLIASMQVKCEGHSVYDIFHVNTHLIPNISPGKFNNFEIHEGEIGKVGLFASKKYNEDGREKFMEHRIEATDPQKKSGTWKVIEGDLLELYNSFTISISIEDQWTTWTFVYEKKTEDTPEPLAFIGVLLDITKDVEGHLLKK
ncbi:PREDICTED: kirola-like [Nicotiana attenuata]|uniref:Mlp-like protein 31 n=1 Tax=Nicotiana attenuata TaxID=49451 RepID=A0A1J6KCF8_NICAT|nr:PREDICTED: kirola-like [Nicotiana attenuata]OIT20491.1 mlp-like protein 31 [Nicotiana attenuata]